MEHGIIAWIIIGAIAGWLAGKIVDGTGLGLMMDIVVGVVGAFIGGYLANVTGVVIGSGFFASIVVAITGAVILLLVVKLVKRHCSPQRSQWLHTSNFGAGQSPLACIYRATSGYHRMAVQRTAPNN
jgi:uncharacterized membrane protein YeaQ/YmgE (transglycosylase-associated protein family)